jgi:predicted Zn-dependent protease
MKTIVQGSLVVVIFITLWLGISNINWVEIFKVEKSTDEVEEKLGDIFWEAISENEKIITNNFINTTIDSIVNKICTSNTIDKAGLKVHVVEKDEINAFALPNGHLVIYSGLIQNCDNPEELAGVMSHEIAHIQLKHVMKKLVKEIGLSVLISLTLGNAGSEVLSETIRLLSSSAYDRSIEKEADLKAVDYMINAKINPENLANFLYKLSENENEINAYLSWISTHPESKERSKYIIEYAKNKSKNFENIVSIYSWETLQKEIQ